MTANDWANGLAIAVLLLCIWRLGTLTPWYRRWKRRQWFRAVGKRLGYDPATWRRVTVPESGDGRPGYSLLLPSRSNYLATFGPDLSRSDFQVMIGPMTFMNAVCWAATHRGMSPSDSAFIAINNLTAVGYRVSEPVADCRLAGEPAVRYRFATPSGGELLEWKFSRDGWLFAVGLLSFTPDRDAERRAMRHLDTWEWTPTT